jgi:CheY-like chemotaxis protein
MRFYQELKADPELSAIPVVIVTALTGQTGIDPFGKLLNGDRELPPPNGFVAKPIEQEEFLSTIAAALKARPQIDRTSPPPSRHSI